MPTYNCKIVVISTCTFDNTPVIYEYVKRYPSIATYIETVNFLLTYKKNNINVEIKQIATSIQMLEFIKVNVEDADLIVIFDSETGFIPASITELIKSKQQLKTNTHFNYKSSINNKIFNLLELGVLKQVQVPVPIQVDDRVSTIFGRTNNQRLIGIDGWLDRWIFCCCCGYI